VVCIMGVFLHTDFDVASISLKKTKNEMLQGRVEGPLSTSSV
jgi:hypothetical protein